MTDAGVTPSGPSSPRTFLWRSGKWPRRHSGRFRRSLEIRYWNRCEDRCFRHFAKVPVATAIFGSTNPSPPRDSQHFLNEWRSRAIAFDWCTTPEEGRTRPTPNHHEHGGPLRSVSTLRPSWCPLGRRLSAGAPLVHWAFRSHRPMRLHYWATRNPCRSLRGTWTSWRRAPGDVGDTTARSDFGWGSDLGMCWATGSKATNHSRGGGVSGGSSTTSKYNWQR